MSNAPSPGRTRLPDRRPSQHVSLVWGPPGQERSWSLNVGFDAAGRVREIFADGHKATSDLEAQMDDICILISLLLQSGFTAGELLAKLGSEGVYPGAPAASIVGQALKAAAAIDDELERRHSISAMLAAPVDAAILAAMKVAPARPDASDA